MNALARFKRVLLILVLVVACVGCDQTTKILARDHLQNRPVICLLGDTVRLQYTENPGAFLSLGASLPQHWRSAVFTLGSAALLAGALLYALLAPRMRPLQIMGIALICGGGMGNLLDRMRFDGLVTDFLNIGAGALRTGIFNVADMALMLGLLLFFIRPEARGQPR